MRDKQAHILTYNGYSAKVVYDEEDKLFVGTILGLEDHVSFHIRCEKEPSEEELKEKMKACIDMYMNFQQQIMKEQKLTVTRNDALTRTL